MLIKNNDLQLLKYYLTMALFMVDHLDLDCLGETSFEITSPRIAKNYIMFFRMLFEKCSSCSGAISQPLNILMGRAFQSTIAL